MEVPNGHDSLLSGEDAPALDEPLLNRRSVLKGVASYIIGTEFCERLCYYGFAGSLVLFFESQLNMSNADAVNFFQLWNGFVYVTPLLGGYLADSYLGRYKTILFFSIFYLVGLAIFLGGTLPGRLLPALVFLGMYVVALGAGGIKPNCSTMGADQFDSNHEQDVRESKLFFSYFYWSINLGALVSYTLVAYICQYGIDGIGGKEWGFFVGYLIPAVALGFGIAIFVSGSSLYRKQPPEGSMIPTICGIFYEALTRHRSVDGTSGSTREPPRKEGALPKSWLDNARKAVGGSYTFNKVESAKYILKLFPFLLVMVPYWGIYGQTKTAFQIQGCQMNLRLGSLDLPVSTMNIFNNVAILVLVPVFENYWYPYLRSKGFKLSMLTKIGLGFAVAMTTMVLAAGLEYVRLANAPAAGNYYDVSARNNISPCRSIDNYDPYQFQQWFAGLSSSEPTNCHQIAGCDTLVDTDDTGKAVSLLSLDCISCDNIPQMSHISILWQMPLFVLIGISEIFASITSLEFFYSQAPSSVRSVSQAANLFTNALGSWLTIPLTLLVNSNPNDEWIPSNIDYGHLSYYFFVLASLMFAALLLFVRLASGFVYADPVLLEHLNTNDEEQFNDAKIDFEQTFQIMGSRTVSRNSTDVAKKIIRGESYAALAQVEE